MIAIRNFLFILLSPFGFFTKIRPKKIFGFFQLLRVPDPKIRVFPNAANTRPEMPDALKCPTRPDRTRSGRVRSGFPFGSGIRIPTLLHTHYPSFSSMAILCEKNISTRNHAQKPWENSDSSCGGQPASRQCNVALLQNHASGKETAWKI